MVGSPFILINKNGRRTLLNTAQVTGANDVDVLLTDGFRRQYWQFPPDQEIGYLVHIDQPDGPLDFMFTKKEERDEFFDKIIAAISPSAIIESAPGLPHTWPELARMGPPSRYILEGKEYSTFEEYWQARDELHHKEALAAVMAQSSTPPTSKPPRKPQTPRE
jgi:hypothetical protein